MIPDRAAQICRPGLLSPVILPLYFRITTNYALSMALSTRSMTRSSATVSQSRRSTVAVRAAAWQTVSTKAAVAAGGGKLVIELPGTKQRVLLVLDGEEIFAVSNKCSHLGEW